MNSGECLEFSKIDLKLNPFIPFVPLSTGHTQTVLGHIVPSENADFTLTEVILELADGDELLLEYCDNKSDHTISIYHGLGGDSRADYIQRSAVLAGQLGWNVILVNHRGANNKARAVRTYHSGRGEDADAVLRWARKKFGNSRQIALGFSMSGSILLNLVTRRHGEIQPDFAIVVNSPLDLARSSHLLTRGFSKIYDYRFYFILKNLIQQKNKVEMPIVGRTMDIDELYTSKANGFKDAADYYTKCSTLNYVDKIETPTFVLAAHDDPFIDIADYLKAAWNKNVHLTFKKHGGHMGYFAKKKDPRYGHRWLDHYLESVFKKISAL